MAEAAIIPDFIYNEDFETIPEQVILGPMPAGKAKEKPKSRFQDPYLHDVSRFSLITREQELHLFRKYNYMRWRKLDVIEIQNFLTTANLRLVITMAKRFPNVEDAIPEGNVTLIQAVKTYDYGMGTRFSTWACNAIFMKLFSLSTRKKKYPELYEQLEVTAPAEAESDFDLRWAMSLLPDRYQRVLRMRYWDGLALHEIASSMGVSKQAVGQLLSKAHSLLGRFIQHPKHAQTIADEFNKRSGARHANY